MSILTKLFGNSQIKKLQPYVERINELDGKYLNMSDEEMREQTAVLKKRYQDGETLEDLLPDAFALVREAGKRVLGMRHFDVQLMGGVVLHQGRIAEMKTGEGKTLVATLPCYLNALTGKGVHVVTVNDYLAKRDAEWMGKVHRFLGLTVGCILSEMEPDERRAAYNCDITYGTNSEFGFDYLRDNMVVYKQNLVQRELNFAIVDEVDSILIDEARTPLIISGRAEDSTEAYNKADNFVKKLKKGVEIEVSKADALFEGDKSFELDGDYVIDEKMRTVRLTAEGIAKAERYYGLEHLTDAENTEINHHIQQALKAHGLFRKDRDYVVQDRQVLIVDEFTGRILNGRRYSEGLHQAIEAKEGVKVEHESKTLATITYQNFFRMYQKLSGMTGTAKTEEEEFQGIYKLDVVEIPPNKPLLRVDDQDVIYVHEHEKEKGIIEGIVDCHNLGVPVLVGTVSVEKSEHISSLLKRRGIEHVVLNAKNHRKEAEIVAQAGKLNAVTIATNMAGRGTDIVLGGNPDYMARKELRQQGMEDELIEAATGFFVTDDAAILDAREKYRAAYERFVEETREEHDEVVRLGGLHIIGTERHESRRIDNQLRGRSGRQGDPGYTRFYLSLEDDLLRLFGGETIKNIATKFGDTEGMALQMGMLTKQIESSQKRVESMHFGSRKHVLQYDDVMNQQRSIIYAQRARVLNGEDVHDSIMQMVEDTVSGYVAAYCPKDQYSEDWDLQGMCAELEKFFLNAGERPFADLDEKSLDKLGATGIQEMLLEMARLRYEEREKVLEGAGLSMRDAERELMLKVVDNHWIDHIDAMDQLREGISLQAYAQKDPVVEYKIQGFAMFDEMIDSIRETTLMYLYHVSVSAIPQERKAAKISSASQRKEQIPNVSTEAPKPVKVGKSVGRNEPCPCGSGKKYKNCCMNKDEG